MAQSNVDLFAEACRTLSTTAGWGGRQGSAKAPAPLTTTGGGGGHQTPEEQSRQQLLHLLETHLHQWEKQLSLQHAVTQAVTTPKANTGAVHKLPLTSAKRPHTAGSSTDRLNELVTKSETQFSWRTQRGRERRPAGSGNADDEDDEEETDVLHEWLSSMCQKFLAKDMDIDFDDPPSRPMKDASGKASLAVSNADKPFGGAYQTALDTAGLSRVVLRSQGVDSTTIERMYSAFFVYSLGCYQNLSLLLHHCPRKAQIMIKLWQSYLYLLEVCNPSLYYMSMVALHGENKRKERQLQAALRRRAKTLRNQISTLKAEISRLDRHVDETKDLCDKEVLSVSKLRDQLLDAREAYENQSELRMRVQTQLQTWRSGYYRTISALEKLQVQHKQMLEQRTKALQVIEESKRTVRTETEKTQRLRGAFEDAKENISSLQQEYKEEQEALAAVIEATSQQQKTKQQYMAHVSTVTSHHERMQLVLEKEQSRTEELLAESSQAQQDTLDAQHKGDVTEEQLVKLTKSLASLVMTERQHERELRQLTSRRKTLIDETDVLTQKLKAAKASRADAQAKNSTLKRALSSGRTTIGSLSSRVAKEQEELKRIRDEKEEVVAKSASAAKDITVLEETSSELAESIQQLKEQNAALKEQEEANTEELRGAQSQLSEKNGQQAAQMRNWEAKIAELRKKTTSNQQNINKNNQTLRKLRSERQNIKNDCDTMNARSRQLEDMKKTLAEKREATLKEKEEREQTLAALKMKHSEQREQLTQLAGVRNMWLNRAKRQIRDNLDWAGTQKKKEVALLNQHASLEATMRRNAKNLEESEQKTQAEIDKRQKVHEAKVRHVVTRMDRNKRSLAAGKERSEYLRKEVVATNLLFKKETEEQKIASKEVERLYEDHKAATASLDSNREHLKELRLQISRLYGRKSKAEEESSQVSSRRTQRTASLHALDKEYKKLRLKRSQLAVKVCTMEEIVWTLKNRRVERSAQTQPQGVDAATNTDPLETDAGTTDTLTTGKTKLVAPPDAFIESKQRPHHVPAVPTPRRAKRSTVKTKRTNNNAPAGLSMASMSLIASVATKLKVLRQNAGKRGLTIPRTQPVAGSVSSTPRSARSVSSKASSHTAASSTGPPPTVATPRGAGVTVVRDQRNVMVSGQSAGQPSRGRQPTPPPQPRPPDPVLAGVRLSTSISPPRTAASPRQRPAKSTLATPRRRTYRRRPSGSTSIVPFFVRHRIHNMAKGVHR